MPAPWIANELESWTNSGSGTIEMANSGTTFEGSLVRVAMNMAGGLGKIADGPVLTARTSGSVRWSMYQNSTWTNTVAYFAWLDNTGTEVLRLLAGASALLSLQYWNGATWSTVGVAQTVAANGSDYYTVEFSFSGLGTGSGSLSMTMTKSGGGTPITWSATGLTLTSVPNISQARIRSQSSGIFTIWSYVIQDGAPNGTITYCVVGTGTGADNTGATGTYTSIDDGTTGGINDADLVSLAADGDRYSMTAAARSFSARKVNALQINYRARCGLTGPQSVRPYLLISGVRYYAATQALTTTFANYLAIWELNPATGLPWDNATAEAAGTAFAWEAEA